MIRGIFTIFSLVSVIVFPWPFTVMLAVIASFMEPLVPLAVGIFADTLYYTPQTSIVPLFTLYGAVCTLTAFFVRSRLRTSSMKG